MKRQIIGIINGPNLNKLGERQISIYGNKPFDKYLTELQKEFTQLEFLYFQTNHEGGIIDKLQEWNNLCDTIVLNAGAYTHTSIAIADCIADLKVPIIEVHISNIYAREDFRHHSYLSKHCKGVISGFGLESYRLAILYSIK